MLILIFALTILLLWAELAYSLVWFFLPWAPALFFGVLALQVTFTQHPSQPVLAMQAFAVTAFVLRFLTGRIRSLILWGSLV